MRKVGTGRAGSSTSRLVLGASLLMTACVPGEPSLTTPRQIPPTPVVEVPPIPRDLTLLLAGDSVPLHLKPALRTAVADVLGWRVVSATVPGCSIYGDDLAWPDGSPHHDPGMCPAEVLTVQRRKVRRATPDVVLWWDRLSTLPILDGNGTFVRAGSERFWRLRMNALEETFERLSARGAWIVFVSTEPIGIGLLESCAGWRTRGCREWRRFRMRHYADITRPMNRILRRYAAEHPDGAVFISITDTICRRDVSPCVDRMWNGRLARPDGTHYDRLGELRAAKAIVLDMRKALRGKLSSAS